MISTMRTAIMVYVGLTLLTGVIYPMSVTLFAQLLFPSQANGTLIQRDGKCIGSELVGQEFVSLKYFWGRPSATSPNAYNASSSGGSNLGPTNPALMKAIAERVALLKSASNPGELVPVDLVTTSASGLDPHISPAAAEYQVERVAKARGMNEKDVRTLLKKVTQDRQWGVFGEPRVNVLRLNIALDQLQTPPRNHND